ncbi:hypothetical protein KS4_27370 [Poriferisphaera corsica]|uniref:Uncharacterized protein n=1 Tax=Poriferisphaera corsica TaxID=2528020 RepID=A0A517YWS7_9BACT|nr:hypothetical protein [Poriferisphaera corsica]QDU34666.1 hypothetical protein KS4_27370 [Poriferisphaera corsica]
MEGKEIAESMLDALIPLAEEQLVEHGEFYPFGGIVNGEGEILAILGEDDESEVDSHDMIEHLKREFQSQAVEGEINACCVLYEASVEDPDTEELTDAIVADVDVTGGYTIKVCQMYELKDGECELGNLFAMEGEGEIFKG